MNTILIAPRSTSRLLQALAIRLDDANSDDFGSTASAAIIDDDVDDDEQGDGDLLSLWFIEIPF
jgi:hypothetical protein